MPERLLKTSAIVAADGLILTVLQRGPRLGRTARDRFRVRWPRRRPAARRHRTAVEQARLVPPRVPARPRAAREEFEVGSLEQRLDPLVHLVRLAAVLAARRQHQLPYAARPRRGRPRVARRQGSGLARVQKPRPVKKSASEATAAVPLLSFAQ